jgi:sugar phosphate isomerase/epimerase
VSILQFGISTHLYHDQRLGRDHLVEIAAHGFEVVEIFANPQHFDATDAAAVDNLAETLRDIELRAHAVHAPVADSLQGGTWGGPYSIATGDATARGRAVDAVAAAIRLAHRLEAPFTVLHIGVPDAQQPAATDNRPDAARRSLEGLEALATPLGVTLALELIPNRLSTADRLVRWIEDELELPGVGVCFDFGHAQLGGDLLDDLETLSGHVVTTHVHDNAGRRDDHLVPFEGRIDWDAAAMALLKIGYDGPLVFELAASDRPREVLERAERARTRLEQLLRA